MEPNEQTPTDQQPDPSNSNPESNSNQVLSSQTTSQNPQTGVTNELLLETLREQNRLRQEAENRALQYQQELENSRRPAVPAPSDVNIDYNSFIENPGAAIARVVQSQIAPLNQFTTRMRREQAYNQIKAHLKAQQPMISQIEYLIDQQILPQLDSTEPTLPLVTQAVTYVVGQIALSNPSIFQQNNQQTSQNNPPTQPETVPSQAHLRPSASPRPETPSDKKPKRPLTELEKRLAREWKMTDDQYLEYLEKPARGK